MRDNGLDPQRDMTDEWEAVLQYLMADELMYVEPFTDAIIQAQQAQEPIDQFLQRVGLWANRYNEVVNYSKMITRPEDRYKWNLGATDKHCSTCSTLNGTVATGQDWLSSGLHPQGAPNDRLECGGWHCDCSLEYTEEPLTEGGIPDV